MLLRPKNLVDVAKKSDPYSRLPAIVNLYPGRVLRFPLKKLGKVFFVFIACFYLVFGVGSFPSIFVMAPSGTSTFAAQNEDERKALEAQLADLEAQISQYETTVTNYRQQGKTLKSEIDRLNSKIAKLNLQIKAINLTISQLDQNISITANEITKTEGDIDQTKGVIGKLLQDIYENESLSVVQILFQNPKLSDFFNNLNTSATMQENLRSELQKFVALRDDLVDKKEALGLQKNDAQAMKVFQDSQKLTIQKTKTDKDSLLKETKGQESKYQELLTQTKKTAAEIRSRIFRLLGGGELPFGDAVKIAQAAEKATGVRAAFILAILTQESAINGVIGRDLGRCFYNDPRDNPSGSVMSNSQKASFVSILTGLNMDPAKTPVSCPIVSDGAYGGAMGPAQFMPNTWLLYQDRVGSITGGKPASPFNNLDAFTATALYLQDGLDGCKASYSTQFSQENCAAAKYYAGASWRSYMRVGRYGYRVAERAQGFQNDIDVLNGNN